MQVKLDPPATEHSLVLLMRTARLQAWRQTLPGATVMSAEEIRRSISAKNEEFETGIRKTRRRTVVRNPSFAATEIPALVCEECIIFRCALFAFGVEESFDSGWNMDRSCSIRHSKGGCLRQLEAALWKHVVTRREVAS